MAYRDDALYAEAYPQLYPMMNARTPESICARLEQYLAEPSRYEAMGEEGRLWYERHVVEVALNKYLGYIEAKEADLSKGGKP